MKTVLGEHRRRSLDFTKLDGEALDIPDLNRDNWRTDQAPLTVTVSI